MTVAPDFYRSEGHRMLLASSYSPSEIARLVGVRRPRVSEWRKGLCTPTTEARTALEAVGIPARLWDAPPLATAPRPGSSSVKAPPAVDVGPGDVLPTAPELGDLDLPSLGLAGLERLAGRLRALEPTLPPQARVSALQAEARVLAVHETLRQRDADARGEYLASKDFRDDVRLLMAAVPGSAATLRARMARLGVALPEPPSNTSTTEIEPPRTADDVEELCRELRVAAQFRERGETSLALAHTLGLGLDVHAGAIAAIMAEHPVLAVRVLALLDEPDEMVIRAALERAMALRDVQALPPDARKPVAELLRRLGHFDVAGELGG